MSRAALLLAHAAVLAVGAQAIGCADTARRLYLEETVDDLAYAPSDPDDLTAAGEYLVDLAEAAALSTQLTLTDCMRLTLVHHERLQARGETLLQAETLRYEAISRMLPRASFSLLYTRNSDAVSFGGELEAGGGAFLPREYTNHQVGVAQPLFDPGVVPAYRLATATRRLEALLLDNLRDELLFQTAAAFYEVLGFARDVAALRSTLEQVDEQLRVLEVRLAVGEAQRQELLLAEARRAEVEVELERADLDRATALARLVRLTGIPAPRELIDTLNVETPPPGDLGDLVALAYEMRPDLRAARVAVEQAERRRDLVLSEYLPVVTLNFDYYTRAVGGFNQFLDWSATVNVLWDIFDGGAREARLVHARSVERERALLARGQAQEVRLEVIEALLAYSALERTRVALETRRRAAQGSQELASLQFAAGEATNLDVLVAVAERQAAERNEIRGEFARKLGALRIWLATGQISRSPPARRLLEARR